MPGTFQARTDILRQRVGKGRVTTTVNVNQTYARFQHEGARADGTYRIRKRPHGGTTGFLRLAIGHGQSTYTGVAARLLDQGPIPPMRSGGLDIAGRASAMTPIDTGVLRGSYSVTLTSADGTQIVRPARYPRLADTRRSNRRRTVTTVRRESDRGPKRIRR